MKDDNEREQRDAHDNRESIQSNYYGLAPGVAGVLFGLALIAFMFAVADGFA